MKAILRRWAMTDRSSVDSIEANKLQFVYIAIYDDDKQDGFKTALKRLKGFYHMEDALTFAREKGGSVSKVTVS